MEEMPVLTVILKGLILKIFAFDSIPFNFGYLKK